MQTEIHFRFTDINDPNYHIITNCTKYHRSIVDLDGWLNKILKENTELYGIDKETIEVVLNKLHEILLNYQIDF